jgi:hypothetical protein
LKKTLSLAVTLACLLSSGCSTVGSSRQGQNTHVPSIGGLCPISDDPALQDAQRVVLDLEMQAAQARYDLDSAKLRERQNDLLQQQSDAKKWSDAKRLLRINDQLQDLDRSLSKYQQRLSYKIQWVDALRVSDCWGAKIAQDALDHIR